MCNWANNKSGEVLLVARVLEEEYVTLVPDAMKRII